MRFDEVPKPMDWVFYIALVTNRLHWDNGEKHYNLCFIISVEIYAS